MFISILAIQLVFRVPFLACWEFAYFYRCAFSVLRKSCAIKTIGIVISRISFDLKILANSRTILREACQKHLSRHG